MWIIIVRQYTPSDESAFPPELAKEVPRSLMPVRLKLALYIAVRVGSLNVKVIYPDCGTMVHASVTISCKLGHSGGK